MPLDRSHEYLLSFNADYRAWTVSPLTREGATLRVVGEPMAAGEPPWIASLDPPRVGNDTEEESDG